MTKRHHEATQSCSRLRRTYKQKSHVTEGTLVSNGMYSIREKGVKSVALVRMNSAMLMAEEFVG